MTTTEEIKALTRIAVALEKIAEDGITMHHEKPEPDGREDDATAFVKANPSLTVENTEAALAAMGVTRGRKWVKQKKMELGLPVGRKPIVIAAAKPFNHRGLKIRDRDYIEDYPDEKALSSTDIQRLEAFAIEAIKQNPRAGAIDLWSYIREHRECGLHRSTEWIDSHR
jgi:hypothetical protein